jgi:putative Mg2+ transporter-C (MgtC) family protein
MSQLDQIDALIHGWFGPAAPNAEAIFRLLMAALAGGLTGLEREHRGREAGFRTNILVCMGSALAMLVSYHVALLNLYPHGQVTLTADPGRVAYGVMAGIGFLGSGAIIREGTSIRGLTTAANIWCMAAVGLAFGLGLYVIGFAAVLLALLILLLFHKLEAHFPRLRHRRLVVRRPWSPHCVDDVVRRFTSPDYQIADFAFDRSKNPDFVEFSLRLTFASDRAYRRLERELLADEDFRLISTSTD